MKRRLALPVLLLVAGSLVLVSCDKMRAKSGAARGVAESIRKGAAFLRKTQHADGGWGSAKKGPGVGITGLVLEALAKTPRAIRDENKDLIRAGVAFLMANRRKDGSIVNADGQVANYRTSISARALIAIDAAKYKEVIDAAVRYTKGIQGTDSSDVARYGSMGYGSDPSKGDIINTSEALEMLKLAGVSADDDVFKRAMVFLRRTQNLDESADPGVRTSNDGGAIYRAVRGIEGASKAGTLKLPDGTVVPRSYGGATYSLLKSLLFAGMKKDHPRVQAAYKWISDHYTVTEHPELGKQGLFYFYYTMVRTLELWGSPTIKSGNREHSWPKELATQVISLQRADGSWINENDRWWEADPALVTAYSILSLNSCYRMMAK